MGMNNWACACPKPEPAGKCCKSTAKICHFTVETAGDLEGFENSFVYVRDERTTYHLDCNGNQVAVSTTPLFEDNHNAVPGQYNGVQVFDFANMTAYVYDYTGQVKQWSLV